MTELLKSLGLSCLDSLEEREWRFLAWGVTDFAITHTELAKLIGDVQGNDVNLLRFHPDDVIQAMLQLGLMIRAMPRQIGDEAGYRSRMAETVRLTGLLRQWMNKHGPQWMQAPTLVADFRFLRRHRTYPRRDIPCQQVLDTLAAEGASQATIASIQALLGPASAPMTLAGFQLRATARVLRLLEARRLAATIVCAETGSGKTLAFYLPALGRIVQLLDETPDAYWVKALAIYPRNELLKDQFTEVFQQARRLVPVLAAMRRRKLLISAFYGDTPWSASVLPKSWLAKGADRVCPYINCPDCGKPMLWKRADLQMEVERLTCDDCHHTIEPDEIILTRNRLKREAPDILFTTTEMLNQRMADGSMRHLFGLGRNVHRKPEMVLLDEVHTYSGNHGALVAYLLRRWRYRLGTNAVHFVGLSATLKEAAHFFSQLTGVRQLLTEEVSARPHERCDEGAEYLMAVRGDPVSRTALLATTIQATMLMSRMLDPLAAQSRSEGIYGSKTFVFVDDLDVINRLYFSMLDAEGWQQNSRRIPNMQKHPNGGLAHRRQEQPSWNRYVQGQDWQASEQLGHDLSHRMVIGRTTSQDAGVAADAEIVIASSSLEVGYNDPQVGAVIQHKAALDIASFLQRKGRGGRRRGMRPWTIVVLSDYGRDRLAYQNYEATFSPELEPRYLPLNNRYVQRIAMTYALIDYFGDQAVRAGFQTNTWNFLRGPQNDKAEKDNDKKLRRIVAGLLAEIMDDEGARSDLFADLSAALGLSPDELAPLVWEFPRPLMTAVVPTVYRQMASNWRKGNLVRADIVPERGPLPQFAPATLFSDLSLPEVTLIIPDVAEPLSMPVLQALSEFAAGRVSKRFGISHGNQRHWFAPDGAPASWPAVFDISGHLEGEHLGAYAYYDPNGQVCTVRVFRPDRLFLARPPIQITDTSNARLAWQTQIVPMGDPSLFPTPSISILAPVIQRMRVHTHRHQCPIEVRRFARQSVAELKYKDGGVDNHIFDFVMDTDPVALGFNLTADGLAFEIHVPADLHQDTGGYDSVKWRALRNARYFDEAWRGHLLGSVANPFAREWLAQIYLNALTINAVMDATDLETTAAQLASGEAHVGYVEVLETIFQVTPAEEDEEGEGNSAGQQTDRLRQDLLAYLGNPAVLTELHRLGELLWKPVDASWGPWLNLRYRATVAAAIFRAVQDLCPEISDDALVVDLDGGPISQPGYAESVWISEAATGGTGLIEQFLYRYGQEAQRFYGLVEAALQAGEFELVDAQLQRMIDRLGGSAPDVALCDAVNACRQANGHQAVNDSYLRLRQQLMQGGLLPTHAFLNALTTRVMRPGSNSETDMFLHGLLEAWLDMEAHLGIEVDARVVAALAARDPLPAAVRDLFAETQLNETRDWRFGMIYGLLWGRGAAVRQRELPLYSRYMEMPKTERLLVVGTLQELAARVLVTAPDWRAQCVAGLRARGKVILSCPKATPGKLHEAFHDLMIEPVDIDLLLVHPKLIGIRQTIDTLEAMITLQEVT